MASRRRLRMVIALVAAVVVPLGAVRTVAGVPPPPTVTAIAVGGYLYTCAVASGGAKCWGDNSNGQLGNGTTVGSRSPVPVLGLGSGVAAVAAGAIHACALSTAGGVTCWGNTGYEGRLGDGTTTSSTVPVDVSGLASGVMAIAAGHYSTCALTVAGGVMCWGLHFVNDTSSAVPVAVPGLDAGAAAIAVGGLHTCVLTIGGGVKCWGRNDHGQLGTGTLAHGNVPTDVQGLTSGVRAISAGARHSCAVTIVGRVLCWGSNQYGQLGDGSGSNSLLPVPVPGLDRVTAVAAGVRHTCALTEDGGLKCWGQNAYGQLGSGAGNSLTPVGVQGLAAGVTAVSAGERHTCAVMSDGRAFCWGRNASGELGDGIGTNRKVPQLVDFAIHQTLALRSSEPPGRLRAGTAVTFTATVAPLGPAGERAIVRFEIHRLVDGVWRRNAHRDVVADASGRASLRWTFATTGSRYVRAMALEGPTFRASPWSLVFYLVR